jgi:hypothetical protein
MYKTVIALLLHSPAKKAGSILVIFVLCVLGFGQAFPKGQPDIDSSGNRFLAICGNEFDTSHLSDVGVMCLLYVVGLNNGIAMFADKGSITQMYCTPEGVTHGQSVRNACEIRQGSP